MKRKQWFLPILTVLMVGLLYLPQPETELHPVSIPAMSRTAELPRININTAPVELLIELPGIGETLAQRIVDYREANGPFAVPEDITAVQGIGEGKLSQILDYITTEDTP